MKKIFSVLFIILIVAVTFSSCGLTTPRPHIKSGEFNFSVTYEYAGEVKTVSGVYVCQYAGLFWTLEGGYSRDWSGYIKGSDDNDHIAIDAIEGGDEVILVLDLQPDYFMGDFDIELYGIPAPYIMIKDYTDYGDYEGISFIHGADEIEALCGAKIISYEYDAPIENEFGLFK